VSGTSADRSGCSKRPRPNCPRSSSRSAAGSMMAAPRSSAPSGAARAGKTQHSRANRIAS